MKSLLIIMAAAAWLWVVLWALSAAVIAIHSFFEDN